MLPHNCIIVPSAIHIPPMESCTQQSCATDHQRVETRGCSRNSCLQQ